jgi:hypothetical protein
MTLQSFPEFALFANHTVKPFPKVPAVVVMTIFAKEDLSERLLK